MDRSRLPLGDRFECRSRVDRDDIHRKKGKPIRNLVLIGALAAPLLAIIAWPAIGVWSLLLPFAFHMLLLRGVLDARSPLLGPVVERFSAETPEIWLTIDDGPDPEDTPVILDLLDEYQALATFFVKGERAVAHPELIRAIIDRGHSVGNHSWSHPSGTFWCLGPGGIARQIGKANDELEEILGERPTLFRAPVGMKNPFVHPVLDHEGMDLVAWSARGWDTVSRSPAKTAERIARQLEPGAIVLLHEGVVASGLRGSETIRGLLERVRAEGYRCVIPNRTRFLTA